MKKIICAVVMIVVAISSTFAFSFTERCASLKGDRFIVKAGLGIGATGIVCDGAGGSLKGLSVPISADMFFFKIPLGIVAEFTPTWGSVNGSSSLKGSSYAILGGASWHINVDVKKLDVYASARLGFRFNTIKWDSSGGGGIDEKSIMPAILKSVVGSGSSSAADSTVKGNNFAFASNLGATYFFTDKIGANVEVGWPTIISASAAIKF